MSEMTQGKARIKGTTCAGFYCLHHANYKTN